MDSDALSQAFRKDLLEMSETAKAKCNYDPHQFLIMVKRDGAVETAKNLLEAPREQSGFTRLFLCSTGPYPDALKLTVEYHVLLPRYKSLFSDDIRAEAKRRLDDCHFKDFPV